MLFWLMECPIMRERRVSDRVLYGLMECPIIWSQCEGSRGVWAHGVTHYIEPFEGSRVVWAHGVPLCGEPVLGIAFCMGSWSVPLYGESV